MNSNLTLSRKNDQKKRIIIFLDVDCYEVQLWMNILRPDLIGKDVPVVVVNDDDIILSLNYRAKILGVKRGNGRKSLHEARYLCGSQLVELHAGKRYGKVDTFYPQIESDSILKVLQEFLTSCGKHNPEMILERSSKDEFFLDVTNVVNLKNVLNCPHAERFTQSTKNHPCPEYQGSPTVIMEGKEKALSGNALFQRIESIFPYDIGNYENEIALFNAAKMAQSIMFSMQEMTKYGYKLSAGVGHSKLVAKLACSRNKPEGICIITDASLPRMRSEISFQTLPGFGGGIGSRIKNYYSYKYPNYEIRTIEQLMWTSNDGADFEMDFENIMEEAQLKAKAIKLRDYCQFVDLSPVRPIVHQRTFSTSISFKDCKSMDDQEEKISNLAQDMHERLLYNYYENGRMATELVVKADMKRNPTRSPTDFYNTLDLKLGKEDLDVGSIYYFICHYIRTSKLVQQEIRGMHLTARNIIEEFNGCYVVM